jgi:hypothetical protein
VRAAELLGREGKQGLQQALVVFVQRRVAPPPNLVPQGLGVVALGVVPDPVVDALPGHPEHAGDVSGGAPLVDLQDGQGAA